MNADELTAVFAAAVAAMDPAMLTERAALRYAPRLRDGTPAVVAVGKAAAGMTKGLAAALEGPITGVAVTPEPASLPPGVRGLVGSHPHPDEASVTAGEALLEAAAAATGPVVALISGGGSALAEVPAAGVSIDEIAALSGDLMAAGADIVELNTVRTALSRLKGGGLAKAVRSGPLITLIISDVAPAGPEFVASGPTLPPATDATAAAVLEKYGLAPNPGSALAAALAPRTEDVAVEQQVEVIADAAAAAAAAAAAVEASGHRAVVAPEPLAGEARVRAVEIVRSSVPPGVVTVYWGETTVTVTGSGRGGRNHEAALAATIELDGDDGVFLAAGTDGVDGDCAAAGAVVDGATAELARAAGLDSAELLAANDSCRFFSAVPGSIAIGPTGTNVADLWMYARPT